MRGKNSWKSTINLTQLKHISLRVKHNEGYLIQLKLIGKGSGSNYFDY